MMLNCLSNQFTMHILFIKDMEILLDILFWSESVIFLFAFEKYLKTLLKAPYSSKIDILLCKKGLKNSNTRGVQI